MNNSAIYDRFIDMFLESSEDYEPYGAIVQDAAKPRQVIRSWGGDAGETEPVMANRLETEY